MRTLFLSLFLLILPINFIFSQDVETLPRDPRIKTGTMANGFKYYLVKSDKMKGFADFYLVQKVGSSLEDSTQKGLTAIIGDMGIRGTRNFPGYTIIHYIDELGMDTERDFQIINGPNNSLYRMANVPVGRGPQVIDSTLLILFNWACSINIDEDDVRNEKLYYKNILVKDMDLSRRTYSAHVRNLFPGSGFDVPHADTMLNRFDSYTSKDIRKYYYKWYRPELQSLVVVGDIDSLSLDTQIKTLFQATPRYLDSIEAVHNYIPYSDGIAVSKVSDKEAVLCDLDIYLKTPPLPSSLRVSAVPFVMDYMNGMMSFLLEDRFKEMASSSKVPIMDISAEYGSFMRLGEMESLHISAKTSAENVDTLLNMITSHLYGIKQYGFSRDEFISARDRYFEHLNYIYDWRIYTTNDTYSKRCIRNFLGSYSLASIEMNKEYMDVVYYEIGLSQFNTFVSSYIRNGDNCTITCSFPENDSLVIPSQEHLKNTFFSAMKNPSLSKNSSLLPESFINEDIKPGTIVAQTKEPITNSVMWTLSNGAVVLYKNTQNEPNKISFNAVAKGGLSLINGNIALSRKYINDIAAVENLGSYSASQVERYMNHRRMSLKKEISLSTSRISGDFASGDMKSFMELVNLHFTASNVDNDVFEHYKKNKKEELKNINNSPEYLFADSLSALLYSRSRFSPSGEENEIDQVNLSSIATFIKQSYSNAANFTFMFVGDADEALLKEYVCKYIASIPGNPNRKDTWRVIPYYLQKRDRWSHITTPMELPRGLYNVTIAGASPYNAEDMAVSTVVSNLIGRRIKWGMLRKGILVDISSDFKKFPEEFMTISLSFVSQNYADEYIDDINDILKDLMSGGVSQEELNMVRSILKSRSSFMEMTQNSFWMDILTNRFIYGKDFYSKQTSILDALTLERVNTSLSDFLKNCSHIVLTMSPQE